MLPNDFNRHNGGFHPYAALGLPFPGAASYPQGGYFPAASIPGGMNASPMMPDISILTHQIHQVCAQASLALELVQRIVAAAGYIPGQIHAPLVRYGGIERQYGETAPSKIRETDSHLFCDFYLPQLTMGDVEVEVVGNRVVARTRVPVSTATRWWANREIPRGVELFELPDGRVELDWIIPDSFVAKEVEATWRDGWLTICVPKTEAVPRHLVKVGKESSPRRASEMSA